MTTTFYLFLFLIVLNILLFNFYFLNFKKNNSEYIQLEKKYFKYKDNYINEIPLLYEKLGNEINKLKLQVKLIK